ncbi:B cell linker L homeolog isoform X4 [Xenopus laevis]|uniref:B cell linker L homeolog isoform X4 n=1 Tax=Xenopus laevis TaxID=8355 RepID=A0A8J1L5X2_XENLA|nr:B cell linker L homeolog isoform X4 [Xenopus laevis]
MACKLPLREEFESWTTPQVMEYLKQFGLQECAEVLDKQGLNGCAFLNMTERELNKFNILFQPQLQKIVHDIKKNDGGIMQKIKKIKSKPPPPPTVPQRDYVLGEVEEEFDEWSDESDSEYVNPDPQSDSETYVIPAEEDDNYEPPPTEPVKTIPSSFTFSSSGGGYADKQGNRQLPPVPDQANKTPMRLQPNVNQTFPKVSPPLPKPNQRLHNGTKSLPLPVPKPPLPKQPVTPRPHAVSQNQSASKKSITPPKQQYVDEEEYIVPGEEEDNYIEPTQDPPFPPPVVNRSSKPVPPALGKNHQTSHNPVVYEVPESEKPPSPAKRNSLPLPRINSSSTAEPACEDEYEPCDELETLAVGNKKNTPNIPSPLPRKSKPLPAWSTGFTPRDINGNTDKSTAADRNRTPSVGADLPPLPHSAQKLPIPLPKTNMQKPPEVPNRYVSNPSRKMSHSSPEEEAGVLNKEWYAASCDRKKAEEALYTSCKDGSFLVRQSSGQDPKQPYTLVVFYNRKVYNIPVRFIEETRQYALGREKSGEEKFSSVAEMIMSHQRMPLVLIDSQNNTKDSTKLRQAIKVS